MNMWKEKERFKETLDPCFITERQGRLGLQLGQKQYFSLCIVSGVYNGTHVLSGSWFIFPEFTAVFTFNTLFPLN